MSEEDKSREGFIQWSESSKGDDQEKVRGKEKLCADSTADPTKWHDYSVS